MSEQAAVPANSAISVQNVDRYFWVQRERLTTLLMLRQLVQGRFRMAKPFYALQNVSCEIARGERIAVIGDNGAGKSTFLRLLAGLQRPDRGTLWVTGSVALVTSLGTGMIEGLSVCDNIFLYGAIFGIPRSTMKVLLPEVLEWAGVEGFARADLRTLSTGMRARLAFSIIRYINSEVFLLDEVLSAGDIHFREKCRAFFDEKVNESRTFVVVAHDMAFIESFCHRALWLNKGQLLAIGECSAVLEQYRGFRQQRA